MKNVRQAGLLLLLGALSVQAAELQMEPAILLQPGAQQVGEQLKVEPSVSKLEKITDMVVKNRFCLKGEGCPEKLSLFVNFMLGFGMSMATTLLFEKASQEIGKKMAEKKDRLLTEKAMGTVGRMAAVAALKKLTEIIENIGYKKLLNQPHSLSIPGRVRCLFSGRNCDNATRRFQFFKAGRLGGTMGVYALKAVRMLKWFNDWIEKRPEDVELKFVEKTW